MEEKELKCEKCNVNKADAMHTCPYQSELCDDFTECNCCDDCCQDCADDI